MGFGSLKSVFLKLTSKKVMKMYEKEIRASIEKNIKHSVISYAQEGEDIILNRFLNNKETGFFVDIGAHHPKRFSNTFNFYKKGWRGINIDAMPDSMIAFKKERPEDINLEIGISKTKKELNYYMFNEPALNTFSEVEAKRKDGLGTYKIIEKRTVITYPLVAILDKYLGENQVIDFISIDAEGLDLEVIQSNNWDKYRPTYVLVEDLKKYELEELLLSSELYKTMLSHNYKLVAKTFNTLFFKDVNK
mgnify:CR=1 FL=1